VNELRPLAAEDSPTLLRWRNLPEIARHMYTDHTISPEEHAAWFERALRRDDARYRVIVADGVDVGLVNLTEIDRRQRTCSWAFYIAEPSARGKGVGAFTEYTTLETVFAEIGFRKLSCEVLDSNPAVLAMHERFGFVREGRFREQIEKAGDPVDVHRLGILAREWSRVRDGHREALLAKGILDR
jgi:UDP-4-amino-4,6-dideoxy-N-acetyl-beta-L-altrosamine N-acetyltransferase